MELANALDAVVAASKLDKAPSKAKKNAKKRKAISNDGNQPNKRVKGQGKPTSELPWYVFFAALRDQGITTPDKIEVFTRMLAEMAMICTNASVLKEEERNFGPDTISFDGKKVGAFTLGNLPGCGTPHVDLYAHLCALMGTMNSRGLYIYLDGLWTFKKGEDVIDKQDRTCHSDVWAFLEEIFSQLQNMGITGDLSGDRYNVMTGDCCRYRFGVNEEHHNGDDK